MQGSATLSMAYAGALFADSCLRGLNGDSKVFDYSYVESDITDVPYFSSRVDLGPDGMYLALTHAGSVSVCSRVEALILSSVAHAVHRQVMIPARNQAGQAFCSPVSRGSIALVSSM